MECLIDLKRIDANLKWFSVDIVILRVLVKRLI